MYGNKLKTRKTFSFENQDGLLPAVTFDSSFGGSSVSFGGSSVLP